MQRSFERIDAPLAYLRTTVVNLCRAYQRQQGRRRALLRRLPAQPPVSPAAQELLDVIDTLPYRQKAVIVLRYYEDLSEADIAKLLRCRPGTVKSLASRALTRLRKEIEP